MKFYSILIVTLGASNYVAAADDNINMLRGILPHLKKMKDDGEVVNVLADDKENEFASVDKNTSCNPCCVSCEEGLSIVDKTSEMYSLALSLGVVTINALHAVTV